MRAVITNSYYESYPFLVHWIGRWENGKKMHYVFKPPFRPYFYHRDANNQIIKHEVDRPSDVPLERVKYSETWEADIVFPERVLIDMGIRKGVEIINPKNKDTRDNVFPADYNGIPLKKIYIDIETDETQKMDLKSPKGAVLSISMRDSFTNLTTIYTTIPEEKINTKKLMNFLRSSNTEIRDSLMARGLEHLIKYVGNMDIHVVSFKSEKDMLKSYKDYLYSDNYGEINIGYNINGFDIPYLQNRAIEPIFTEYSVDKRNGKPISNELDLGYYVHNYGRESTATHGMVTNFDLYRAYLRLHENDLESSSLESVSQIELGIGKIKHKEGYKEMYDKEPEKFLVYNYRDSLLCQLIDMKLGVFDFFLMLSNKAGTLDIGKWNATYLIDTLLFRVTHNTDFKMPTHKPMEKVKVPGGKVIPASRGVYDHVVVFDFKHLYPRIIRQFNMSYETILFDDEIGPDDICIGEINGRIVGFSGTKKGIMPSTLLELETERYEIKGRMKKFPPDSDMYMILNNEQRSVKEIDNSFYGMTGSEYARLFDPFIQASITFVGRNAVLFAKGIVEKIAEETNVNYIVRYGDTDSIFIENLDWKNMSTEDIIRDAEELNKRVNASLIEYVRKYMKTDTCILEMEFEKLYSPWAQFGAQKQYVGYILWKDGQYLPEPKFNVIGFDPRRSDSSIYSKKYLIPTLLKKVLKDREEAVDFIYQEMNKWEKHNINVEDIGIYFSLKKDNYESNYQQKRAVDNSIKFGIELDSMKGKYRMYFLKGHTDVVALNYDDPVPGKIKEIIDWDAHMRRCFTLKVEEIGKSIGIEIENKKNKKHKKTNPNIEIGMETYEEDE